eukprot:COSAG05_NODE_63_length_22889_cov_41.986617_8_plen_79_part_00
MVTYAFVTDVTRLLPQATEHTFGLHGLGNALEAPNTWDNAHLHSALESADNSSTHYSEKQASSVYLRVRCACICAMHE